MKRVYSPFDLPLALITHLPAQQCPKGSKSFGRKSSKNSKRTDPHWLKEISRTVLALVIFVWLICLFKLLLYLLFRNTILRINLSNCMIRKFSEEKNVFHRKDKELKSIGNGGQRSFKFIIFSIGKNDFFPKGFCPWVDGEVLYCCNISFTDHSRALADPCISILCHPPTFCST